MILEIWATKMFPPFGFSFTLSPNEEYIVNFLRRLIDSKLIHYSGLVICWEKVIPLKVKCFVWRASMGRIHVADTLAIRGINTTNSECPMCNKELEIS